MYNEGFFYNAIKRDIAMVRGDTMSFGFQVKGLEGEIPDHVYFSVKDKIEDDTPLFMVSDENTIDLDSYEAATDTLTYTVRIPPAKTQEIELGRYFYDLRLEVNGDIITLMNGRLSVEFNVFSVDMPEPPVYDDGDGEKYPRYDIPEGQKKIYTVQYISNIAAAIQQVNGGTTTYDTEDMSGAVLDIGETIEGLQLQIADLIASFPPEIDDVVFPET